MRAPMMANSVALEQFFTIWQCTPPTPFQDAEDRSFAGGPAPWFTPLADRAEIAFVDLDLAL